MKSLCIALLVVLLPQPVAARTWHILEDGSGDAPTVQAGIDSSTHGDIVLVGPGTYYENINLRGKAIHLQSSSGPSSTALDGSLSDSSVVVCNSNEGNDTIIEGFTITNGKGTIRGINGRKGAGILCEEAAPIIRGNVIRDNRAVTPPGGNQSRGGGIFFYSSFNSPRLILEDNVIEGNFATTLGGGIQAESSCLIQNNVIQRNATERGDGAGIYISRDRDIFVHKNLFLENNSGDHGGGMYINNGSFGKVHYTEIEISENVIIGNQSMTPIAPDCSGAGIWLIGGAYIHHNTIAFNRSSSKNFPAGAGICLVESEPGTVIEHNLIYKNNEGGVVAFRFSGVWGATVRRNLIYGNGPQDVYNLAPADFDLVLEANVFADPVFCGGSRGEVAGSSPALNQPFGFIGAKDSPGCGPYLGSLGDGKDIPDTSLSSCVFPDSLGPWPDSVSVTVVSKAGPIAASSVEVRVILESGLLDPGQRLASSAVTRPDGKADVLFPQGIGGVGILHFVVTADGYRLCTSESYAVDTGVSVLPTTWGRIKAKYQGVH